NVRNSGQVYARVNVFNALDRIATIAGKGDPNVPPPPPPDAAIDPNGTIKTAVDLGAVSLSTTFVTAAGTIGSDDGTPVGGSGFFGKAFGDADVFKVVVDTPFPAPVRINLEGANGL